MIKRATLVLIFAAATLPVAAQDDNATSEKIEHHGMMHSVDDGRISLGLSAAQKQHQLSNMRSHLEAVQTITGLIAEQQFEQAAQTAHTKLGLTDEMKKMCNMFSNETFRELGLAFHKSGDELGEALLKKDSATALRALNITMGYCVECHATFRQ